MGPQLATKEEYLDNCRIFKGTNCKGLTAPEIENFLVAPFSTVAIQAHLTDPENMITV